jgi:hypothetical protein
VGINEADIGAYIDFGAEMSREQWVEILVQGDLEIDLI